MSRKDTKDRKDKKGRQVEHDKPDLGKRQARTKDLPDEESYRKTGPDVFPPLSGIA